MMIRNAMIFNTAKHIAISLFFVFYFEGLAHGVFNLNKDPYSQQGYDHAEFGILDEDGEDFVFENTNRIPNKVGITYGWNIHLTTHKEIVTWKEEFILPAPAQEWGDTDENGVSVSVEGTKAITERTVVPEDGWISNYWSVAEGDPSGKYIMKIYIDGTLVKKFIFFIE